MALICRWESSSILLDFYFALHLGVASTSWMGLCNLEADLEPEASKYTFEEVQKIPRMRVVDWQGKPSLLVDTDCYIFTLLGGHPRDANWDKDVTQKAAELMEEATNSIYNHIFSRVYYSTQHKEKKRCKAGKATLLHKKVPHRGTHHLKSISSSMGGGQEVPTNFFHSVLNTIILTGLLVQEPFQHIVGFTNSLFQTYAPNLHLYYHQMMEQLHTWNQNLQRNFLPTISVFAAATFNFSMQTVTFSHLDFTNLAWSWCTITALGDFDPDYGGHIILWDLKLIICFLPECTLFIPSALVQHSNTSVQAHKKQFSFTQYTVTSIFHFVNNGFCSEVAVNASGLSAVQQAE
ncbi:hypothetical protein MVEN_01013700 [Mycena venus]|uniref:Uncharacterized protein n=1 Tax=Mycena venus TaxID=2733690 RepID=A0A8H7CZW9_9AGAR|nr:hypothetical protein MVEN_01013700 [Mycena venus]